MLQQPGRTTFDTKFDLTADPAAFLGRALHLWSPVSLGELQNQAYGYLFPQGPWFLGLQALGVPDWLAQRLWSALLLVVAYEGTRRLCRSLGLPGTAATLGGLGYALAPRLLGASGVLSGEVLPQAVLPWAVLPLAAAVAGRISPRRAGLLSGLAVLCMSGVNATGTLAALPVALLVAASRLRRRGGAALLGWWAAGTALACAWWFGPLIVLGRYSPPFLDFIETAAATTAPAGWANAVRGAEHWVAYHSVAGQDWWPGAHTLVTSPLLAVLTTAVTACGLAGLVHRRTPLRGPLLLALVLGLLCLTAGNASAIGSLVDEPVRALLDGPLAALRNVHKVDPLIRLPVAVGLASAVALAGERLRAAPGRRGVPRSGPAGRRLAGAALAAVLLAGAAPLVTGGLRTPGWDAVPDAWSETAAWLADRPDSRALVVPGSGFGVQTWGWTIDEPLQGVARGDWVTRSQVPLVPGPTARVLDAVETRLADGRGGAGLSAFLARAGITHVVLRRDLDPAVAQTAAADRAERALLDSPGLARVASFGRTGFGDQALVDVFAVAGASPRATLADARDLATLDGGPEDVLAALDAGVLPPAAPVVVGAADGPADVVSDGYRRVERQFGRVHDAVGEVMTPAEPYRDGRPEPDYPGAPAVERAAADFLAVDGVTASSSQGYPDALGPVLPAAGPAAALDGRPETAWRSAAFVAPVGQWLDVDLDRPVTGGVLAVTFLDTPDTATVRTAQVSLDGAPAVHRVPEDGRLFVPLPATPVHHVRVTVSSVAPGLDEASPVGVAEIGLPGVGAGRTLEVPRPIGADTTVVLSGEAPRRACVDVGYGPHCETSQVRATEWHGLDRRLTVAEAGAWDLTGTVVATPGPGAAALLAPVDDTASATSDSVYGDDPSVAAVAAFDGLPQTPWLADPDDAEVTLDLRWPGERTVSRIVVDPASVPAAEPVHARIESAAGVRDVDLTDLGFFEPLRAPGGLSVTFTRSPVPSAAGLPLGVGEVRVDGLEGLQHRPSLESGTGAVCGLGPEVRVDGTVHRTGVTGTLDDVVAGRPLTWRVCDGPVALAPGTHRVVAAATAQFQPVALTWRPAGSPPAAAPRDADDRLRVVSWADTRRVVAVTAGAEAVLRIAENVNAGWRATLDGEPLETVVLDGWQQGYRVPAGASGEVVVEFAPDAWYRGALLAGLVLAVVLVLLLLADLHRPHPGRLDPGGPAVRDPVLGPGGALALGLGGLVLGGVPLAAGWVAGLAPPLRRYAVTLGGAALLAAGVLTALSAGLPIGRPGPGADGAAAAGVGLLVASAVRLRRPRRRERSAR
ncbi:alpha-(1-_3)-arabinofuranosyltransferase family protein [Geodermatophilus sp. SYSU D00525]